MIKRILISAAIVSVLAAAMIPMMQGKIDKSKWSEANAAAGMIRNAATAYYVESGEKLSGAMDDEETQDALGIEAGDLEGTYFQASDYNIDNVNDNGVATVTVTASKDNGPTGSKTLYPDGRFE